MKQKLNQRGRTSHIALRTSQKGITLIALVITIIVLLILAGVTINMVLGDNGIIGQAQKAKQTQENAEIQEVITIWEAELETAKHGGSTARTWENVVNELEEKNLITEEKAEKLRSTSEGGSITIGDKTITIAKQENDDMVITIGNKTITRKNPGENETIEIATTKQTSTPTPVVNNITADHYGDTVEYNGSTDWQIFYNDGTNVYLIAKDYVPNAKIPESTGISTSGSYVWAENNRDTLINYLKDTNTWNTANFYNSSVAKYVVGAPTLDMFVASWNDKNKINATAYPKLFVEYNDTGALIGTAPNTTSTYVSLSGKVGYNDPLYFIKSATNASGVYWLASPSANAPDCVMFVHRGGDVGYYGCDYSACGVRPAVCLKSDIQMTPPAVEGGAWTLQ